jgi:glycerol-3-phosphate cytidylyltransferase-like family protein
MYFKTTLIIILLCLTACNTTNNQTIKVYTDNHRVNGVNAIRYVDTLFFKTNTNYNILLIPKL